jgi:replicative DNA helicase
VKLTLAINALSKAQMYVDDTAMIKINEIRSRARKLAKETGNLGLIVIDYLQLITGNGKENRQQEISDVSRQLKILAKELNVPVIALSQLSRSIEQRQDKRPMLSDIRESGSIEQDADIVSFIDRDYYGREGDEEGEEPAPREDTDVEGAVWIIAKNRAGSQGDVNLMFHKNNSLFVTIDKQHDEPF